MATGEVDADEDVKFEEARICLLDLALTCDSKETFFTGSHRTEAFTDVHGKASARAPQTGIVCQTTHRVQHRVQYAKGAKDDERYSE